MALSIQLIFILIALFISNFLLINKKKYDKVFMLFIALLLLIPASATGIFSGISYDTSGVFNISIAGYDVLISLICFIFIDKNIFKKINKKKFTSMVICILSLLLIRFLSDGIDAISNKMFDNYFLPMIMAILAINYLNKNDLKKIFEFFFFMIIINAAVACIEFFTHQSPIFHNYYLNYVPWYKSSYYVSSLYGSTYRTTALLGHPLTGGIFYVLGIVYLYNNKIKNKIITIICLGLLLLAIYSTNSRTMLFLLIFYTIFILIKKKRILELLSLILVILAIQNYIGFDQIYSSIFARDASGASFGVRIQALNSITKIPFETIMFGTGYNNTRNLLETLGFKSNFEISYLIILVENGLIGFIIWLKAIKGLLRFKISEKKDSSLGTTTKWMIILFFCSCATFNGIGDPGTLNYVLWLLVGISYILSNNNEKGVINNE